MTKAACVKRSGLWSIPARTMALACLLVFMAQMATTVYLPSLPTVMRELAMSRRATELSISIFVIGAALPVLFWGAAADRFGRRAPLTLSLFLFIGCSGLLALCSNGAQLLTLRALQGVGAGGAAIIARIIVRDNWSGDELARRLSVLSIAFITALGGGQFVGGLLSQYSHWQMGFVLMGATGLAILALMATLPLEAGRARGPRPAMAATYFAILRRPGFFWPACVGGLGFAITVTLQEVSPFVMQQGFGLNVTAFGALGLVIGVAYCADGEPYGGASRREKTDAGRQRHRGAGDGGDPAAVVERRPGRPFRYGAVHCAILPDHFWPGGAVSQQHGDGGQRCQRVRCLCDGAVRLSAAVSGGRRRGRCGVVGTPWPVGAGDSAARFGRLVNG